MISMAMEASYKQLYPFESHFLNINGMAYHYLDEGRGEPLLMVHGNPTWSFYYRSLVTAFSDRYRVIVPDHIGCGLSDKPGVNEYEYTLKNRVSNLSSLMDYLSLDQPVTLVVHDWGGMIGLSWALDHLNQVGRIIVMNTAGFFPPRGKPIPRRLKLIRSGGKLMRFAVLYLNLFARAALYMAPRSPLPANIKQGLIAPYDSPRNRVATLKFVLDIPLGPEDPSGRLVHRVDRHINDIFKRPAIVLWGAHDFVFDRDYFLEWQRRLPGIETHWFDDAGHYLLEDIPDKIISHIKEFLRNNPLK
ncbi:MAG: alpha/beta fold hydrolase [Desulfobacteraceae bacterium]